MVPPPLQAASKEAALAIMRESVRRSEATGAANAESLAALSEQVGHCADCSGGCAADCCPVLHSPPGCSCTDSTHRH